MTTTSLLFGLYHQFSRPRVGKTFPFFRPLFRWESKCNIISECYFQRRESEWGKPPDGMSQPHVKQASFPTLHILPPHKKWFFLFPSCSLALFYLIGLKAQEMCVHGAVTFFLAMISWQFLLQNWPLLPRSPLSLWLSPWPSSLFASFCTAFPSWTSLSFTSPKGKGKSFVIFPP